MIDFKAIYDSGLHHPLIAWLGAIYLALLLRAEDRRTFLWKFLAAFGVIIALDALCTGAWSPVPASLMTGVSIVFVILGDLRLFILAEHSADGPGIPWVRALILTLVVPITQAAAVTLRPQSFADPREIYLFYELCFVMFVMFLRVAIWPWRVKPSAYRVWVHRLVAYFLVLYALWAVSDVIILAGGDWGHLLRIVPNVMYYAGFLVFAKKSSPGVAWT